MKKICKNLTALRKERHCKIMLWITNIFHVSIDINSSAKTTLHLAIFHAIFTIFRNLLMSVSNMLTTYMYNTYRMYITYENE